MTKLWLSLALTNLIAAVVIFVDQIMRYNIWWEWDELYHHEPFVLITLYAALILLIVAFVEHRRNLGRS